MEKKSMKKPHFGLSVLLAGAAVLLLSACISCSEPASQDMAIYLVESGEIAENAGETDLDSLILEEDPWITMDDIEFYDYSTHFIFLNSASDFQAAGIPEFKSFAPKPFVVTAGGKRIYLGFFHSASSSLLPTEAPFISVPSFTANDIIRIQPPFRIEGQTQRDVRFDSSIKEVLHNAGKLEKGIKVELLNVLFSTSDNGSDATAKYTLRITNQSSRTWYVPDTDLMGVQTFIYYTGGILFTSETGSYRQELPEMKWEQWQKGWYTQLEPEQSLIRIVTQTGFPIVTDGHYSCSLRFTCDTGVEKSERMMDNGEIWIGFLTSDPVSIAVQTSRGILK